MTKKFKQKSVSSPLSRYPYNRREESEIIKILGEIDQGMISKLGDAKNMDSIETPYVFGSLSYPFVH